MPAPGGGSSSRSLAARGAAVASLLFGVGTVVGLVAALLMPPLAGATARPTPVPVVAVHEAPAADCVPASVERRAAQVLVVGLPDVTLDSDPLVAELTTLGVGGVFINDGNAVSVEQVTALTGALRDASTVPLLISTDEEAGRVSSFRHLIGGTSSPRTLAATQTPAEVRTFAHDLGAQLAGLGITVDLAPVADLDAGLSTGLIGDRSFSADPLLAGQYAQAFAEGLTDAGVMPVVKHFPGHGGAVGEDVHRGAASVTTPLTDLMATDVMPFVSLIEAGAPIVMTSHVSYDALDAGRPASVSRMTYRLLRDLGFSGVAMTDSIGMGAIHRRWDFPEAAVEALRAGADAVLATDGRQATAMVRGITRAVERGRLSQARLDEAAARMLALKGVDAAELVCVDTPKVPQMVGAGVTAKG